MIQTFLDIERLSQRLGRLICRLARAGINGRDRLCAERLDQRFNLLAAIFAKGDIKRSLNALLLVVLGRTRANQKNLNHTTTTPSYFLPAF